MSNIVDFKQRREQVNMMVTIDGRCMTWFMRGLVIGALLSASIFCILLMALR